MGHLVLRDGAALLKAHAFRKTFNFETVPLEATARKLLGVKAHFIDDLIELEPIASKQPNSFGSFDLIAGSVLRPNYAEKNTSDRFTFLERDENRLGMSENLPAGPAGGRILIFGQFNPSFLADSGKAFQLSLPRALGSFLFFVADDLFRRLVVRNRQPAKN